MNLDYQSRPHMNGLSSNVPYDGNSSPYSQPDPQMAAFEGLSQTQLEAQSLFNSNWFYNNQSASTAEMSVSQYTTAWANSCQQSTLYGDLDVSGYPHCDMRSYELGKSQLDGTPRTMPFDGTILNNISISSHPGYHSTDFGMSQIRRPTTGSNYEIVGAQRNMQEFPRSGVSCSHNAEDAAMDQSLDRDIGTIRMPRSETSDESDPSSRDVPVMEADEHWADEPYAKLIYRALMSVPDHSMVLQEIYQWFRENTNKGCSDSKGWMNSIRHNLSMNAAFKKTERKTSGDETKKSTEWVLEDFAIKDGVQSTTRYRKGNGSKKFIKTENPAPIRQTSGQKGGISAIKMRFQRHRVKDDRPDLRHENHIPRLETERLPQFHYDYDSLPQTLAQRQDTPLTPNAESTPASSPYFFPTVKYEYVESSYEEVPVYALDQVHAVCDDEPLFSPPFSNPHIVYSNHC
ncbi:hypothetical protein B0O99DRAFT_685694 [Bisporella sp. PMI_857]|nr:hypothetical protein B0O99DRAFT_685694 [Bisporella sp. PMI_857]